MQSNLQ